MPEKRVIPYKLTEKDLKITNVEKAFKQMFGNSVQVSTCNIRGGKTSAVIYVPKEFKDKVATVIIWDKPVIYYEDIVGKKDIMKDVE